MRVRFVVVANAAEFIRHEWGRGSDRADGVTDGRANAGGGGRRRGRYARGMMRNGARARGRGDSTRTRETEDARIGENDGRRSD